MEAAFQPQDKRPGQAMAVLPLNHSSWEVGLSFNKFFLNSVFYSLVVSPPDVGITLSMM
jgi:hypothetical protein